MSLFDITTVLHAEVLAALHTQSFEKKWDKSAFQSLLALPTTVGLVNENAFILCSVCADEAEILTVGVVPTARKKGIACSILSEMQAVLKRNGVSSLFLEVNEKNVAARSLYNKNGFLQIGLRKGYYEENNQKFDALLLKKQI